MYTSFQKEYGYKLFPYKADPFKKRDKNNFLTVLFLERGSVPRKIGNVHEN